jgi:replication-associated recombination protein RarA
MPPFIWRFHQNPILLITIEVPGHLSSVGFEKQHYKYPHSYPHNWVDQTYLPKTVTTKFYEPQSNGSEKPLVDQYIQTTGKKP